MQKKTTKTIEYFRSVIGKEKVKSPSPFMNWLKPVVVAAEYGSLTFEYKIREEMTNPMGNLHGGVIAGIIDDIMGATVYSLEKRDAFVTVNLSVDYFAPAGLGDVVHATTQVVKEGRNVINMSCELWLPAKKRLLAKASSNLLRVK
jgi:acyl-coenzyme A thioesterase 13